MKRRLFSIALLLLLQSSIASAQSDTVHYRLLTSFLNDSTLIRYELGSLGLKKSSDLKYLAFADSFPTNLANYFQTEYFRIDSVTDTLSLFRFASFDDKNYDRPTFVDTAAGSTSGTAYLNAIKARYSDTLFYVTPDPSVFDTTSRISYIIEVHDSATGGVVARIDTLKCFMYTQYRLLYSTYPTDGTIRSRSMVDLPHNRPLYITVGRATTLKGVGAFISDQFTIDAQNPPALTNRNALFQVSNSHAPSDRISSKVHSNLAKSFSTTFDQDADKIIIKMNLLGSARLTITISDEVGREVKSLARDFIAGKNQTILSTVHLATGVYFVAVKNGNVTIGQRRITVIH